MNVSKVFFFLIVALDMSLVLLSPSYFLLLPSAKIVFKIDIHVTYNLLCDPLRSVVISYNY